MKRFLVAIICSFIFLGGYTQTISQKTRNEFKAMFVSLCKQMNEQTPIRVDENTTLLYMTFTDWTITYQYKTDYSYTDFTESERNKVLAFIKKQCIAGWRREIQTWGKPYTYSQYVSYLRSLGVKFSYSYVDCDNMPFGHILVTCRDLR